MRYALYYLPPSDSALWRFGCFVIGCDSSSRLDVDVGGRDMPVLCDVLIEFHMDDAVILKRVHVTRFCLSRLKKTQRLGDRHLVDDGLMLSQSRDRPPSTGPLSNF